MLRSILQLTISQALKTDGVTSKKVPQQLKLLDHKPAPRGRGAQASESEGACLLSPIAESRRKRGHSGSPSRKDTAVSRRTCSTSSSKTHRRCSHSRDGNHRDRSYTRRRSRRSRSNMRGRGRRSHSYGRERAHRDRSYSRDSYSRGRRRPRYRNSSYSRAKVRRYASSNSAPSSSMERPPRKYPLVELWLKSCQDDVERGYDNHPYTSLIQVFNEGGYPRVDPVLANLTTPELMALGDKISVSISHGLASRVLHYAKVDVDKIAKKGHI